MNIKRWLRRQASRLITRATIVNDVKRTAIRDAGDQFIVTCRIDSRMMGIIETLMCDMNWDIAETLGTGLHVLEAVHKGGDRYQIIQGGVTYHYSLATKARPKPKHDPVD